MYACMGHMRWVCEGMGRGGGGYLAIVPGTLGPGRKHHQRRASNSSILHTLRALRLGYVGLRYG